MEATAAPPPSEGTRYRALETISRILRVLAWVVLVLGGLGVLIAGVIALADEPASGLAILVGGALYVAFIALALFAYAELIRLMIDMESNTRRTAEAIARR